MTFHLEYIPQRFEFRRGVPELAGRAAELEPEGERCIRCDCPVASELHEDYYTGAPSHRWHEVWEDPLRQLYCEDCAYDAEKGVDTDFAPEFEHLRYPVSISAVGSPAREAARRGDSA